VTAIPASWTFSPILNLDIGSVPMPGFRDYIKMFKIVFFRVLDDKIILAV